MFSIRTLRTLRQLTAYNSISLPTLTAPPAVAKETVYMPSAVAARVLGGAKMAEELKAEQLKARQPLQETL
jgi:hypothetical protein